jgi:hypothetical protein
MSAEIIDFEEEVKKRLVEEVQDLKDQLEYVMQDIDVDVNTSSLDYIMNIPVYSPGSYGDMISGFDFYHEPPTCPSCGSQYWSVSRPPKNEE